MVVVTTGGFSVFSHDCNCCDSYELSLTGFTACCEMEETEVSCKTESHASACCTEKIHVEQKNHSCKTDQCCQLASKFYRLDNSYEKTRDIQINKIQFSNQLQRIINTEIIQNDFFNKLIFIAKNSPPKIPYKNFVVFTHSFKIPF